LYLKKNTVSSKHRRLAASVGANTILVEELRDRNCGQDEGSEQCFRFTALFVHAD